MATTKDQPLNEEALKALADKAIGKPKAGELLPEGFVNPALGELEHICLDPNGRVQPTWFQLYLRRPEGMKAQREFFNLNGKKWRVAYNRWVDVPPEVIKILRDAKVTRYKSAVDAKGDWVGDLTKPGPGVVEDGDEPAFHFSFLRSASV